MDTTEKTGGEEPRVKIKIILKKGEKQHDEEKEMKGGRGGGKKGSIFILFNDALDFYKRAMKQ